MISKDELLFLKHLRSNSRESLTSISGKTSIPISTLFDKLRVLEKNYIIKHTTLANFRKLNYRLRAHIHLFANSESVINLSKFLLLNENVNSLMLTDGDFNLFVDVIFKDMKEYGDFSDLLSNMSYSDKMEYFISDNLMNESFLSFGSTISNSYDCPKLSCSDYEILNLLRKNARIPISHISLNLDVPISTLHGRYSLLKSSNLISHTSILDWKKMGFDFNVLLRVESNDYSKLLDIVSPNLNSLYKLENDDDYLLELIFKNSSEFEDLSSELAMNGVNQIFHTKINRVLSSEVFNF